MCIKESSSRQFGGGKQGRNGDVAGVSELKKEALRQHLKSLAEQAEEKESRIMGSYGHHVLDLTHWQL